MSVKLTLPDSFHLDIFTSDNLDEYGLQCYRYSSSDIKILQDNTDAASLSLKQEAQNLFAALAESEKTMQVILLTDSSWYQYHQVTRVLIKWDVLGTLITKYPRASLQFTSIIKLKDLYHGHDTFRMQPPFKNLLIPSTVAYLNPQEVKLMEINPDSTYFLTGEPSTLFQLSIHESECQVWLEDFTLTLTLPEEEIGDNLSDKSLQINPAFTKKILNKAQHTDLTIVAHDGTEFCCHKCFLSAQSDVFEAMLSSEDMQEAKLSRIEFPDMSKEGIQALLNFIYAFDIEAAKENAEIALELLQAGHKYNIGELEDSMKRLILTWPERMLEVDSKIEVSLCLFSFVRNVEGMEELKTRAFQVLRNRSAELMSCEYYKELFKKDVSAAMELCALSMGHLTL